MSKKTANLSFIDKTNVYVSECLSTNDFLTQLTKKSNLSQGSYVITDFQTKGRGQRKNKWESEKGKNLLFSILMKPNFSLRDQFKLHIIVSLSIKNALKKIGLKKVKIKWPNDIYINDKKISGILIENQIFKNIIKQSIIGIGININQIKFHDPKATSVFNEMNIKFDVSDILKLLINSIENDFQDLDRDMDELINLYKRELYMFDRIQNFVFKNKKLKGRIIDVNKDGRIIMDVNKKKEKYDFGALRFI